MVSVAVGSSLMATVSPARTTRSRGNSACEGAIDRHQPSIFSRTNESKRQEDWTREDYTGSAPTNRARAASDTAARTPKDLLTGDRYIATGE